MIGLILMIAGGVITLIGLVMAMTGRNARSTTVVQDAGGQRTVDTEQQLPPRDVV